GEGFRRGGDELAAPVAATYEKLRAETRRGGVPVGLAAENMGRVGGREAGNVDEPARDEPVEGDELRAGGEQRVERQRRRADRSVELCFRRAEAGGQPLGHAGPHGEAAVEPARVRRAK